MVTDMTSQVPSKYNPAIELQGDIYFVRTIEYPSLESSIVLQTLQQRKTPSSLLEEHIFLVPTIWHELIRFLSVAMSGLYTI